MFILHSKQDPENESAYDFDTNPEDYYIGGFKKYGEFYKPWGKGVLLYKNGNFYEGYFEKGLPNGQGRMIVIENGEFYWRIFAETMQTIFYCVDIIKVKNGRFKDGVFKDEDLYQDDTDNKGKVDRNKDNTLVCLIKVQLSHIATNFKSAIISTYIESNQDNQSRLLIERGKYSKKNYKRK